MAYTLYCSLKWLTAAAMECRWKWTKNVQVNVYQIHHWATAANFDEGHIKSNGTIW